MRNRPVKIFTSEWDREAHCYQRTDKFTNGILLDVIAIGQGQIVVIVEMPSGDLNQYPLDAIQFVMPTQEKGGAE